MIFVSYAWADASAAHDVHRGLKNLGHETWIDFERLDLEGNIEIQLIRAIQAATVLLLLDSPSARESRWIRFEMACAVKAGIPVMLLSHHLNNLVEYTNSSYWNKMFVPDQYSA